MAQRQTLAAWEAQVGEALSGAHFQSASCLDLAWEIALGLELDVAVEPIATLLDRLGADLRRLAADGQGEPSIPELVARFDRAAREAALDPASTRIAWEALARAVASDPGWTGREREAWRAELEELERELLDEELDPDDPASWELRLAVAVAREGLRLLDRVILRRALQASADDWSGLDEAWEQLCERPPPAPERVAGLDTSSQRLAASLQAAPSAAALRLQILEDAFAVMSEPRGSSSATLALLCCRECLRLGRSERAEEWLDRLERLLSSLPLSEAEHQALSATDGGLRAQHARLGGDYRAAQEAIREALSLPQLTPARRSYLLAEKRQQLLDLGLIRASRRVLDQQLAAGEQAGGAPLILAQGQLASELQMVGRWREALEVVGRAQDELEALLARGQDPLLRNLSARLCFDRAKIVRGLRRRGASLDEPPVLDQVEGLLEDPLLLPHDRRLMLQWKAEVECDEGRLDEARRSLAAVDELDSLHALPDADLDSMLDLRQACVRTRLARATAGAAEREQATAELVGALDAMLERWGAIAARAGGIGFLEVPERHEIVGEALDAVTAERGAREGLEVLVRVQQLGSLVRQLVAEPVEAGALLQRFQQSLPAERRVLVYMLGRRRSHGFVVSRDTIEHSALPPEHELTAACTELAGLVATPGGAARELIAARCTEVAASLSQMLLPPELLAVLEGACELSVVGLDQLAWIPFELLPDLERGAAPPMAVDSLPSIPVAVALAERAPPGGTVRGQDLLFLALPEVEESAVDPSLDELRLSDEQRRRILGAFAEGRVQARLGRELSPSELTTAPLHDTAILHLMMHGCTDLEGPEFERSAALLFGDAQGRPLLVRAGDVEALPAMADVVLLAVCGAASGETQLGEDGVSHLGGAFLRAGASCVVLSQQSLGFRATVEAMASIQEGVAAGKSVARALADWSAERRARADWSPFETSLLRVYGLGHAPVPVAPPAPRVIAAASSEDEEGDGLESWAWGALGILGLGGGLWWINRRRSSLRSAEDR